MPTDYKELGAVNIKRLDGSIPFYRFARNNHYMKKYDEESCNGDCLEYL